MNPNVASENQYDFAEKMRKHVTYNYAKVISLYIIARYYLYYFMSSVYNNIYAFQYWVLGKYLFTVNGRGQHCGRTQVQLVQFSSWARWRIVAIFGRIIGISVWICRIHCKDNHCNILKYLLGESQIGMAFQIILWSSFFIVFNEFGSSEPNTYENICKKNVQLFSLINFIQIQACLFTWRNVQTQW